MKKKSDAPKSVKSKSNYQKKKNEEQQTGTQKIIKWAKTKKTKAKPKQNQDNRNNNNNTATLMMKE